jgi:hypothetical protein
MWARLSEVLLRFAAGDAITHDELMMHVAVY